MGNGNGACNRAPTQRVVRLGDTEEETANHGPLPLPACDRDVLGAQDGPAGWCCKKQPGPNVKVIEAEDEPENTEASGGTKALSSDALTMSQGYKGAQRSQGYKDALKACTNGWLSSKEIEQWEFAVEEPAVAPKLSALEKLQELGLPSQDTDAAPFFASKDSVRGLELARTRACF